MGLDKDMMPVPHAHPHVYEARWPVRMADVDSGGRLRLDGAARHIQDIGQDHLRGVEAEETHPLWIVRRTMIDVIKPIDFKEALWLRRWCSATSNRWCQMRVRLDGRDGGLVESEAFWIHVSSETQGPARIDDDFLATVASTTDVGRLRWKPYNKPGSRDTATDIRDFPCASPTWICSTT